MTYVKASRILGAPYCGRSHMRSEHAPASMAPTSGFPETNLDHDSKAAARVPLLTKPYRRNDLARTLRDALNGQA